MIASVIEDLHCELCLKIVAKLYNPLEKDKCPQFFQISRVISQDKPSQNDVAVQFVKIFFG